jgi:predicted ribosomally synthesized peptide with SipW-like signal peptide
MRKIISSLFVIAAVLAVGVVATSAYFSDTITQDNYTFTTGSADLKLGFCGGAEGTDCTGVAATLDNITFNSPAQDVMTGPGKSGTECIVVQNTGLYTLNLSSQLFVTAYSHPDMATAFEVSADRANGFCNLLSNIRPWTSAIGEHNAGVVPLGIPLGPGDRLYILTKNRWNSAGDQNHLQNGYLKLRTVLEGRTS